MIKNNNTILTKLHAPNDFEFPLNRDDTMFTLARTVGFRDTSVNDLVSKMAVIKQARQINANEFSKMLNIMNIKDLNIFSIDKACLSNSINTYYINKGSRIKYLEIRPEDFIAYLNTDNEFIGYNINCLYILRGGDFLGIKHLFKAINGNPVNIGRWKQTEISYSKSFGFKVK